AVVDQADDRLREARRLLRESQELARRLLEDVTQREARLREAMRRLLEEAGALQLERKAVGAYRVPKPKARFFDERRCRSEGHVERNLSQQEIDALISQHRAGELDTTVESVEDVVSYIYNRDDLTSRAHSSASLL